MTIEDAIKLQSETNLRELREKQEAEIISLEFKVEERRLWLEQAMTLKLLHFLEQMRQSNALTCERLLSTGNSEDTIMRLIKENETLTKVLNYARREQYSTNE